MGCGVWLLYLRTGLGGGSVVLSFGGAMGGVFRSDTLSLFGGFFSWGARDFFFFSFFFSLYHCGGLGVLDHGAGLMVCFFSFPLGYTTFHGWTYRTLYISCLMGLYIATR